MNEQTAEIAKTLIDTGNEKLMWVGAALFAVQAIFIPAVIWLFKYFSAEQKKLTDSEREVTKLKRDAENEKTNGRIDALEVKMENKISNLETNISSKITEFEYKLESTCKAIERVGNKMDLLYSKMLKSE